MAESSWPNVGHNSRAVTDDEWEKMAIPMGDGLLGPMSDTAPVYADSSGMQVKVRAGKYAFVHGRSWYSGAADFTKSVTNNSSGSTRIDLVVLRLTRSTWEVTTEVKAGTPGAGVPPTVTQDQGPTTGVWEIPIATVTVPTGAVTITAGNVTFVGYYRNTIWQPVQASDLPWGTTIFAHRGGGNGGPAPENTMEAINAAAAVPTNGIEIDAWLTTEGSMIVNHDSTWDRTTSQSGNVIDASAAQAARITVDASALWHGGWPDCRVVLLDDVLSRWGGRRVLVIEGKNTGSAARIVQEVVRRQIQKSVIVQEFSYSNLTACGGQAAGVPMMHLISVDGDAQTTADYINNGIGYIGAGTAVTNSKIQTLRAAGLKVGAWTVDRRTVADTYRANGIDFLISNEPRYVSANVSDYRRTTSPYNGGAYPHGFQLTAGSFGRGTFTSDGWYSPDVNGIGYVLQGTYCPLANPSGTYTITFQFRFDALGSDSSRWAGVAVCQPTDTVGWKDETISTDNGYHVIIRSSGSLAWFKRTAGVQTNGPTLSTTGFSAGAASTMTLTVSPTQISLTRSGFSALTWADTTHRGAFWHIGANASTSPTGIKSAFSVPVIT